VRRPFLAALAALAALAVAGPARAGSITIDFAGLRDGQSVYTYLGQSGPVDWLILSTPPATAIGPGSGTYAGTPGLTFGGGWTILLYTGQQVPDHVALESISVAVDLDAEIPAPVALDGRAEHSDPAIAGPSWSWDLDGAGTYSEGLGGFLGDTIDLTGTGFWQITSISIDYTAAPAGGGGGSVPEPSGLALGSIALGSIVLARLARRAKKARPREQTGPGPGPGDVPRGIAGGDSLTPGRAPGQ
jgi:hypothetical protein